LRLIYNSMNILIIIGPDPELPDHLADCYWAVISI